jgi:rRNA maturation protein Rpf1
VTETELKTCVIDMAKKCGYLWYHVPDSRRVKRGFPDLVLLHVVTGRVLWVELKDAKGKLRPEQEVWLHALQRRSEAFVWRPDDWPSVIRDVLTHDPLGAVA